MTERPERLARLNAYGDVAMIAHEAVWDLHQRLVARDLANERTRDLLTESARIATAEIPRALHNARRLATRWSEEDVLDPRAASRTLHALTEELDRVAPQLRQLRRRQNEIAAELRRLLDE